jgi:hypothetical protein
MRVGTSVARGLQKWRRASIIPHPKASSVTDDESAIVITDDIMHHIHPIRIKEYLKIHDLYRFKRGIMESYWVDTTPQLPA